MTAHLDSPQYLFDVDQINEAGSDGAISRIKGVTEAMRECRVDWL